jgi:iron uptake system component EfeO
MRANLEGGREVFKTFEPWLDSLEGGPELHDAIHEGFERVEEAYSEIDGNAIPEVPATWNPDDPSEADLATPYGQLFLLLSHEADPTMDGSLVERMGAAADLLGIPQIPE